MSRRPTGSVPRPALADMTNHTRKRVFEVCGGKSNDGRGEPPVSKQVCVGLEKKCEGNLSEKGLSDCETDRVGKDPVVNLNVVSEVRGGVEGVNVGACIVEGMESGHNAVDLDDVSRDSYCSTPLVPIGSESCNRDSSSEEILQENVVRAALSGSPHETSLPGYCEGGDKDVTVAFSNLDQSESSESAKLVKPSGVQSFELERCTAFKGDINSNISFAADMLKTCSCSFCLKAAYIWSDLHYQDVKGRISAVKKSKKEAVNMFQRICLGREANTHGQGSSDEPSKLETDLSSQWRSLYFHMEEAFAREANHYQDQFLALKDLRENCKVNLEMINAKPAGHD